MVATNDYTNNFVSKSDNINFGSLDTGAYLISFSKKNVLENGYDFLKIYEGTVYGELLYQRSGESGDFWPNVLVRQQAKYIQNILMTYLCANAIR
jgi:hypothetical protein